MGTITAAQVYAQAAEILEDTSYVTYLESQLLGWINDAQRAVCLVRPDAKVSIQNITIVAATTRQQLPAGAARLGGLIRNMGNNGTTAGAPIRGPVPREDMDAVHPYWHVIGWGGDGVKNYVYDEDAPQEFYIYPMQSSTFYVEGKLFMFPTDIADKDDPIDLDDIYVPPLREYLLYNTFARDSERTPNWTRAGRHLQNFYQLLGVKTKADLAVSPKILEYGRQLETVGGS